MKFKGKPGERPYERFVREYMDVYNSGENLAELARRMETTKNAVGVYAATLRKNGVRLPRFTDRFDAKHLNRIIAKAKKGAATIWAR